tara:strand:+ start:284 stop:451 length:168 start_codon:yes stop_codon:yes gene_type:complete
VDVDELDMMRFRIIDKLGSENLMGYSTQHLKVRVFALLLKSENYPATFVLELMLA